MPKSRIFKVADGLWVLRNTHAAYGFPEFEMAAFALNHPRVLDCLTTVPELMPERVN